MRVETINHMCYRQIKLASLVYTFISTRQVERPVIIYNYKRSSALINNIDLITKFENNDNIFFTKVLHAILESRKNTKTNCTN